MTEKEDRRPRLLSEQCSTCVFRPGNPMRLQPGRLRDLVQQNLAVGAFLTCHDTLPYGRYPGVGEAMCRGFFDRYRDRVNLGRIMERLSGGRQWWREVPPPSLTQEGGQS
jgi:hypothetical protein